jgi:energy-coupling factor transport system permease protein
MLVGLCALCVGVYAGLDSTAPGWLGRPMLGLGVLVSLGAVRLAGSRVARSRYRPDPWRWPETVVAASGVLVGAAGWWMSQHQLTVAYPSLTVAPTLSLLALVAPLVGLAGALCAPPVTAPATPFPGTLAEAGGAA